MTKRERLYDECLEDINAIMWNSHCLQGREFGRQQGEQIMYVLDRWARISEADDSAVTELENDSKRLRWIMENSGIDGFNGIPKDRYDFALDVARERDNCEPAKRDPRTAFLVVSDDDEFAGWRRLIDAAMEKLGITECNNQ